MRNLLKENKRHRLIQYFKILEKEVPEEEIQEKWNELMLKVNRDEATKRRFLWNYAKIACVAALLGGLVWMSWFYINGTSSLNKAVALLEEQIADTTGQVLLITHSQKQIKVDKGAVIAYDRKGVLSVGNAQIENESPKIEYNQLIVPKGKYSRLLLADGTSLYVNAGTKVVYPNQFEGKQREIYVDGEIFIDVKPDKEKPFIVKTSKFDIQVLGTAFNVNAYKELGDAEVVLLRGSVSVKDKENKESLIAPNEMLALYDGKVVEKRTVDAENYIVWTKGRLLLDGKNMKNIFHSLSMYYGTEIQYDPSLEKYRLQGVIDVSVPLERVLERISKMLPISYQAINRGYFISVK